MNPELLKRAEAARGFMPKDEGLALYEAALKNTPINTLENTPIDKLKNTSPLLEIGSYCGKSSIYIGAAAQEMGHSLFCLDHHRGSEENQAGWEHHEPDLIDPITQKIDTLPHFRRNIYEAGLEETVIAIIGDSLKVAQTWKSPLGFLFIDGGHGTEPAHNDFDAWTPHLEAGGILCIHDVFENPEEGGRPPYEIYRKALDSNAFTEISATGSLRVLQKSA